MKRTAHHLTMTVLCLILSGGIASAMAQQNKAASPTQSPANPLTTIQTAQAPVQTEGTGVPDLGFSILRAVGGLGLVLTLILGGYFAIRKFAPQYFTKSTPSQNMKILETLSMGDRRSISLVEVGNSRFLVGNTPQQINLIMALQDSLSLTTESEAIRPLPKPAPKTEPGPQFRKMYDFEKSWTVQRGANPLPDDLRMKMRQLRRALEK